MPKKDKNKDDKKFSMYILALYTWGIVLTILLLLLSGCSPKIVETVVEKEKVVYRDSVAWRDSILHVPIPLEKNQIIAHLGDTSRLETSVSISTAFIGADGFLHHDLENKRTHLAAAVKIPTHYIYNGVTHNESHTITRYVEVPAELTWWQRFCIGAFWWLILACAIGFRREILGLIKKII